MSGRTYVTWAATIQRGGVGQATRCILTNTRPLHTYSYNGTELGINFRDELGTRPGL